MARLTKLALPTPKPEDAPLIPICINEEWLYVLFNMATRLEWGASWIAGTDHDEAEQQAIRLQALLRGAMTCDCFITSETKNQIEIIYNQTQKTVNDNRTTTYTNSSQSNTSIHVNAPSTSLYFAWNRTTTEKDNLCYVVNYFVQKIAYDCTRKAQALFGGSLIGLTALTYLSGGLGAIVAVPVAIALGATKDEAEEAQASITDQEIIACRLYDQLRNVLATASNFSTAINNITTDNNNQVTIKAMLTANSGQGAFLYFLELLGTMKDGQTAGLVLDTCDCADTWLYNFTFASNLSGWTFPNGANTGSWISTSGGRLMGYSASTSKLQPQRTFTASTITKVRVYFKSQYSSQSHTVSLQLKQGGSILGQYNFNSTLINENHPQATIEGNAVRYMEIVGYWQGADTIYISMVCSVANVYEIHNVEIEGEGANPFI